MKHPKPLNKQIEEMIKRWDDHFYGTELETDLHRILSALKTAKEDIEKLKGVCVGCGATLNQCRKDREQPKVIACCPDCNHRPVGSLDDVLKILWKED